jgi:hypothetical protein
LEIPQSTQSSSQVVVGGYQTDDDYKNDPEFNKVDQYVRTTDPRFANATVVSVSKQVVAGYNYKIRYDTNGT